MRSFKTWVVALKGTISGASKRRWQSSAMLVLAFFATPATAQEGVTFWQPRYEAPEAILLPLNPGSDGAVQSWRLSYRNGLRGSSSPDTDIETRIVEIRTAEGAFARALISWRIERTHNDNCVSVLGSGCPDKIRILTWPEGYGAFPESASVEEGQSLEIYIVPNGVG